MESFSIFTRPRPLSDPISDPSLAITTLKTPGEEHRRQLVEGFEFSRGFIVTYQAAVVGILLVAVAKYQYRSLVWSRQRRRRDEEARGDDGKGRYDITKQAAAFATEELSSSSSSSTQTYEIPPASSNKDFHATERDSLLAREDEKARQISASAIERIKRGFTAGMMYQPSPLPIIERTMPEIETILLVISLLGLNMFYLLYHVDFSTLTSIEVISDRSGLLFVANLPWLYLLAAKNQPLKALTGHSYENLNLLHRRQGELLCVLAAIHFFGMIFAWWRILRPLHYTLYMFLSINYIIWGDFAFVAYEVLYFTSLSSFREWWYEMFLASHVFLQTAGLILLYLHHFRSRPYVLVSLAVFLLDRIVWRLGIKTRAFEADLKIMEDGGTVKVSADWPVISRSCSCLWSWMGRDISHGWETSQHVFLTVPGISKQHVLQFHPMTVASAAPESGQQHAWFNLIIRAKSGFSRDLLHYARNHSSAPIRLDGPYGSLHAVEMLHASEVSIIIAGGSGIAVAYPMIWSLLRGERHDRQQVCLIWVIQDASHVSWLGNERLEELKEMGLHLVIPPPSRKYGRPDVAALLCESLHRLVEGTEHARSGARIGVVVSGPDGLNRNVRNTCARLVRQEGLDIDIAVEKFGW